jgi:hypothetical protein
MQRFEGQERDISSEFHVFRVLISYFSFTLPRTGGGLVRNGEWIQEKVSNSTSDTGEILRWYIFVLIYVVIG